MKICCLLFVACVTFAVPAMAQDVAPNSPRPFEIGWNLLSYSRQGSANLYGGDLNATSYINDHIGITFDFASHSDFGSHIRIDTNTFRIGPKAVQRHGERITTFEQILVGGTRVTGSFAGTFSGTSAVVSEKFNGFALSGGFGVDVAIRPWLAVRPVQVDYSGYRFGASLNNRISNGLQVSGGLVFRTRWR
jgi:hypothetical protein